MKIAIQGIEGSFHDIASQKYFNTALSFVKCDQFMDLIHAVESQSADYGVMAIENTIVGNILANIDLIRNSNVQICGEVFLPIVHCLLANTPLDLSEVIEVRSHPMALLQCQYFLESLPNAQIIEDLDTALCARVLHEKPKFGHAVVASKPAALRYHLNILEENIQTHSNNFTRFFVLKKKEQSAFIETTPNKATIYLQLAHQVGSLSKILNLIADHQINLSTIQSRPNPASPWEYYFHLDMEFERNAQFQECLEHIKKETKLLNVLGIYAKGKK